MRIILAGRGKMAGAVRQHCQTESVPCLDFQEGLEVSNAGDAVAIHLGSGRQLNPLIGWCAEYGVPLIQGSTGQKLPDRIPCPILDAYNLALPIVRLLRVLPVLAEALQGMEVSLVESHQASKKSVPGTAVAMAEAFGLSGSDVVSLRTPSVQTLLGVPDEYLAGHARMWLTLKGGGVRVRLTLEANGRDAYAQGALGVAKVLLRQGHRLENRVYTLAEIDDLMKKGVAGE